jgi:hypothetical protein
MKRLCKIRLQNTCRRLPSATQVIDKFHVIKYVYDAVKDVRNKARKDLSSTLTKGKKKTEQDKQTLSELELVKRVRHAITQSPDKWNDDMKKTVDQVFGKHDDLKTAPDFDTSILSFLQLSKYQSLPIFASPFWVTQAKIDVILRHVCAQKEKQVRNNKRCCSE